MVADRSWTCCRLYTIDGMRVGSTSDLVYNGHYVAVSQHASTFQRLNYGTVKPAFCLTTRYQPPRYVKGVYSSLWETQRTATERHLPYEITFTQCYLLPDTGERVPP